jgi:hypothetical protein
MKYITRGFVLRFLCGTFGVISAASSVNLLFRLPGSPTFEGVGWSHHQMGEWYPLLDLNLGFQILARRTLGAAEGLYCTANFEGAFYQVQAERQALVACIRLV